MYIEAILKVSITVNFLPAKNIGLNLLLTTANICSRCSQQEFARIFINAL